MDRQAIIDARQAIIDRHGAWTSHNVALPYGLFTMGPDPVGDNHRVHKFLQVTRDVLRRPLNELRVLDLACLEGLYAIEFAQQGAEAVGVEGREANIAKARFAKDALRLPRLEFIQDDVRNVTLERFGTFDVVLCSGILYHLDSPDVFRFLKELRRMCSGLLIVDTRIALANETAEEFEGRSYGGVKFQEHDPGTAADAKLQNLWASLDNEQSFWFTRQSLCNFLGDAGFTSVFECLLPVPYRIREDRMTVVALAGQPCHAYNAVGNNLSERRWPEGPADGSSGA